MRPIYLTDRAPSRAIGWADQTKYRVPNSNGDAVADLIGEGTGRNRRCAPCR